MATRFIFQSQGNAVAFIENRNVYALDGELVGFIDDREGVYDRRGEYKGFLLRDGRVALDTSASTPPRAEPRVALERRARPNVIPRRRPLPELPSPFVESFVVEPKEESERTVAFPSIAFAAGVTGLVLVASTGYFLARTGTIDFASLLRNPAAVGIVVGAAIFLLLATTAALAGRERVGVPRLWLVGSEAANNDAKQVIGAQGASLGVVAKTSQEIDPVVAKAAIYRKEVDMVLFTDGGAMPAIGKGKVLTFADYVELRTTSVPLAYLDAKAIEEIRRLATGAASTRFAKRAFDVAVAALLLVFATPALLLAAIEIKLDSAGPLLYRQRRIGLHGRPFWAVKFRTMRNDAGIESHAMWATKSDPRVTRVGSVLRMTRIDELPQLIGVLRGQMSIVGPRPERFEFAGRLREQIPGYELRYLVKPGITGWAQVRYSYGASVEDAKRKHEFDLYYVKRHSVLFDFQILVETVAIVLFKVGVN